MAFASPALWPTGTGCTPAAGPGGSSWPPIKWPRGDVLRGGSRMEGPPGPGMSSRGSEPSGYVSGAHRSASCRMEQGAPAATTAAPWGSAGLAFVPPSPHRVPPEAVDCAPLCPLHDLGIGLLAEFSPHAFKVPSPHLCPQAGTSLLEQGRRCSAQEGAQPEPCLSFTLHVQTSVCMLVNAWGVRVLRLWWGLLLLGQGLLRLPEVGAGAGPGPERGAFLCEGPG